MPVGRVPFPCSLRFWAGFEESFWRLFLPILKVDGKDLVECGLLEKRKFRGCQPREILAGIAVWTACQPAAKHRLGCFEISGTLM